MRVANGKPDHKQMHTDGYVLAFSPGHPRATHGRVFEHILIAEKMLGRPLLPDERVHHKGTLYPISDRRNRADNREENLEVLSNSAHSSLHADERHEVRASTRVEIACEECGAPFKVKRSRARSDDPRSRTKYCSLACRRKSWSRQVLALRKEKLGY